MSSSRIEHMFETVVEEELDAGAACRAVAEAHQELVALGARQLRLAAHWIDLHAGADDGPTSSPATSRVLRWTERRVRSGAPGTPWIGEFAAAEFAAVQDLHPAAGAALLRKVADLRHRHPLLWARVQAEQVRAWKALETTRLVSRASAGQPGLPLEGARFVDARTHEWIDTLPWSSYVELVEKMIVAADPRRAETARQVAAAEQFVITGQSNEHGLKTLIAKAGAGDVVYLVAVIDKIADALAARGDTRPVGPRRAAALGIIARPAHALALLATGPTTAENTHSGGDGDDDGDGGDGPSGVSPSFLDVPADLRRSLLALLTGAGSGLDPERLLPRATLYVHLSHDAFNQTPGAESRFQTDFAHAEGIGPITLPQAREWLGHHRVTLVPVLDPESVAPVTGYTFTSRHREALHATLERDVFPYAVNTGRGKDIDHVVPYRPPDAGGPPGQTGLHNAAPIVRYHHRIKTHANGWHLTQLTTAEYLWRAPHGHWWITAPTGSYRIPPGAGSWIHQQATNTRAA